MGTHDISKNEFLERIYEEYARPLERMCLYYTRFQDKYRGIVDDSIQQTFETATRQYKELRDNPYLEGWLYRTCMNRLTTSLRAYRRHMARQVSLDDNNEFVLPPEQIRSAMDEIVNRMSNQELLERILSVLNDRERNIVHRHFVMGESTDEIATSEHTTAGAIKAILARIRAKARKIGRQNNLSFVMIIVSFFQIVRIRK